MITDPRTDEHLPHWDLTNIYPGLESEGLRQAFGDLKAKLDDLEEYARQRGLARLADKAARADPVVAREAIAGYLERADALLRLMRTMDAFISSYVDTDSFNTTAKRLDSELEQLGVRFRQQQIKFQGWLGGVAGVLDEALAPAGPAREHAFFLKEMADQSRYMMSEAEETLAAELSASGTNAWSRLQNVVCSQLTAPLDRNGRVEHLPVTVILNLASDPDPAVRRSAYEAEIAAWETVKEPLAAAMNGVKGTQVSLNKRRGRTDALHGPLDQSRIDRETLETMLGVMQDSFPVFRQYLQTKARKLGEEALPWWDLFAPLGKSERRYTYAEARDFILTHFGKFSPRAERLARRAFAENWIDAEPRTGKRGGAFCMSVPAVEESRILVNYDGSLSKVITIAHELGHAYNNECQHGKTMLQRISPMTLAETASTFCETIVTDAALADAASPEEELAILEAYLSGATQVIVDISSRFRFEKEVFERREKAELSADELSEIMLRSQEATYGDGLDKRYLHKYMWTWKPHYYFPDQHFYNFPYAFGLLFGTGLYAIYRERGASFVPEYEALLASTGEGKAADLAARFGLDIRKPGFWEASIKVIAEHIRRFQAL